MSIVSCDLYYISRHTYQYEYTSNTLASNYLWAKDVLVSPRTTFQRTYPTKHTIQFSRSAEKSAKQTIFDAVPNE